MNKNQTFFTVNQLADRWQLKPVTIRDYIKDGKLTPTRLGRGKKPPIRVHVNDVENFEVRGSA